MIISALMETERKEINGEFVDVTKARQMIDAIIAKAIEGDVHAFNSICDRVEGKPKQQLDVIGKGLGDGVTIIIERVPTAEKPVIDVHANGSSSA
jgi:hypothetical protein